MTDEQLPQATRQALEKSLHRRDWDGVAAVIAAFVGLLALCVSGYTAYLQRQQVRAQVWPYLEPGVSGSKHEVILFNKGVGPAIVKSVQMYVDGKPQHNWHTVLDALGLKFDHPIPYSTVNGVVISANDHIDQLVFPTTDDFNLFTKQASRLEMRICYCSTLNECWVHDDRAPHPAQAFTPIDSCPAHGPDDFRDNEAAEAAVPAKEEK